MLAYLGDAYYEILAREYLVADGNAKLSQINQFSKQIVTASAQASFADRMLPMLDEQEMAVFKAGRNAKSPHRTKSASAIEYRIATGVECLFGYFFLNGMHERAKSLFLNCVMEIHYERID